MSMSKSEHKQKKKKLVQKAIFKFYMKEKEKLSKLEMLEYTSLQIQPYLITETMTTKEINLLYSLRSRCHESKLNFRKMNKNDLRCRFGCDQVESQEHIFTQCIKLKGTQQITQDAEYKNIGRD